MGPNKQQHNKNMLSYDRQSYSPGLVALYDIRPGNGSGPFTGRFVQKKKKKKKKKKKIIHHNNENNNVRLKISY